MIAVQALAEVTSLRLMRPSYSEGADGGLAVDAYYSGMCCCTAHSVDRSAVAVDDVVAAAADCYSRLAMHRKQSVDKDVAAD